MLEALRAGQISSEANPDALTTSDSPNGLENADFDSLYYALEKIRLAAVREQTRGKLDGLIAAAQAVKSRVGSTLGQPQIVNQLDAHLIALDPKLAFTQPTPELDAAMVKILDTIRDNTRLADDEKILLVQRLNANNGPGSNYKL